MEARHWISGHGTPGEESAANAGSRDAPLWVLSPPCNSHGCGGQPHGTTFEQPRSLFATNTPWTTFHPCYHPFPDDPVWQQRGDGSTGQQNLPLYCSTLGACHSPDPRMARSSLALFLDAFTLSSCPGPPMLTSSSLTCPGSTFGFSLGWALAFDTELLHSGK